MSFGLIRLTKFHLIARAASASKRIAPLSYNKSIVLIPLPCRIIKRQRVVIAMKIGTVIGIGAGGGVDGQVLVTHDMLGMTQEFHPRFLRRYLDLHSEMTSAFKNYISDVLE